ncbi:MULTISPECIES: oligosaccharide flippase family protein [unclassified Ensifer]|uniref:oligosaccharide flippase family protein n=1 Tax=Ensifer sp. OTU672 TaxID=3043861 RepID=UPI0009EA975D
MKLLNILRKKIKKVRSGWHAESTLRGRLKNITHLLTGNFASAFIGLVGFALTARALGPADYGLLALSFAYVRGIERFVSFRSWQPLIKYGALALETGDSERLKALFKLGLLIDLATAFLGWGLAVLIVLLAGPLFGISDEMSRLVLIYCAVLPLQVTGMPTAVMRLYGRFKILAYGQVAASSLRTLLCIAGVYLGWGLFEFLVLWMASQICGSINRNLWAFREIRRQGLHDVMRVPLGDIRSRFPGFWSFSFQSNVAPIIQACAFEFDTLLVGYLADPVSAGLYHIAKRVAKIAQQAGEQVQAVLYPDLARAWATQEITEFRKTVNQTGWLLFGFGLFALFTAQLSIEWILRMTAGSEFVAAAPLVVTQFGAVIMLLCSRTLFSALLAMGHEKAALQSILLSGILFLVTALMLLPKIGALGANVAHIVMSSTWFVQMAIAYRRRLTRGS